MSDLSDLSELPCTDCAAPAERVRYFPRKLLTADDLTAEQDYLREKRRRHQRFLHGWGVVCGCDVRPAGGDSWSVSIAPGYAVSPLGDEIWIDRRVDLDLRLGVRDAPCTVAPPCPPDTRTVADPADDAFPLYVAARYAECYARPVTAAPAGCNCDDSGCEYSRVRDSFEIKVLRALPASHRIAAQEDAAWRTRVEEAARDHGKNALVFPVPACPRCSTDPWVVLATVTQRKGGDAAEQGRLAVTTADRRGLLSVQRLQGALATLAR